MRLQQITSGSFSIYKVPLLQPDRRNKPLQLTRIVRNGLNAHCHVKFLWGFVKVVSVRTLSSSYINELTVGSPLCYQKVEVRQIHPGAPESHQAGSHEDGERGGGSKHPHLTSLPY